MDDLTLALIAARQPHRAIRYSFIDGVTENYAAHAKCLAHPIWGKARYPIDTNPRRNVLTCNLCASEDDKLEWEDTWTD